MVDSIKGHEEAKNRAENYCLVAIFQSGNLELS